MMNTKVEPQVIRKLEPTNTAGFFMRGCGFLIDSAILIILFMFLSLVLNLKISFWIGIVMIAIYIIGTWTFLGASIGKLILGMKIVKSDGEQIDLKTSILRFFTWPISLFPLPPYISLGFLWIIWSSRKQAWHDSISGTYVVYTRETGKKIIIFAGASIAGAIMLITIAAGGVFFYALSSIRNAELISHMVVYPDSSGYYQYAIGIKRSLVPILKLFPKVRKDLKKAEEQAITDENQRVLKDNLQQLQIGSKKIIKGNKVYFYKAEAFENIQTASLPTENNPVFKRLDDGLFEYQWEIKFGNGNAEKSEKTDKNDVEKTVKRLISSVLRSKLLGIPSEVEKISKEKVLLSSSLKKELNFDKLDYVMLTTDLEDEFYIEISDSDAEKWETVSDVVVYVSKRLEGRKESTEEKNIKELSNFLKFKIKYTLILPGDILETNADYFKARKAVWEFSIEKLYRLKEKFVLKAKCETPTEDSIEELKYFKKLNLLPKKGNKKKGETYE